MHPFSAATALALCAEDPADDRHARELTYRLVIQFHDAGNFTMSSVTRLPCRRQRPACRAGGKCSTPQVGQWFLEQPAHGPSLVVAAVEALGRGDVELVRLRAQAEDLQVLVVEFRSVREAWREQAVRSDEEAAQLRVLVRQTQALAMAAAGDDRAGGRRGEARPSGAGTEACLTGGTPCPSGYRETVVEVLGRGSEARRQVPVGEPRRMLL